MENLKCLLFLFNTVINLIWDLAFWLNSLLNYQGFNDIIWILAIESIKLRVGGNLGSCSVSSGELWIPYFILFVY